MTDLLITNGTILTQDDDRKVLDDGAVAVENGEIVAVDSTAPLVADYDADRVVEADGQLVLPGFINAHTHVSDILLRGSCGRDRTLFDWLYNVKRPGVAAMESDDHAIAAALYCAEAIQSGVTTFVENDAEMAWEDWEAIEAKLNVYDASGVRAIYARGFMDLSPDEEYEAFVGHLTAKQPEVNHPEPGALVVDTDEGLADVAALVNAHHGRADGRLGIWIAPVVVEAMTTDGLQGAYELAEAHDVMTTTHVSESELQERDRAISSVEYLDNIGYLGERTLLGHCVHLDDRDVRLLSNSNTRVSHNLLANLALGSGIAPVPSMLDHGVTVCLGTDNTTCSDTVNPVSDVRTAARVHQGVHRDPGLLPPQQVLDMVTIDAARAIRRADELGSIEVGKRADLILLDLNHPHLTPAPNPASAVVYQAQGFEIGTVICDGSIIMRDREVVTLEERYPELLDRATRTAEEVLGRAGIAAGG